MRLQKRLFVTSPLLRPKREHLRLLSLPIYGYLQSIANPNVLRVCDRFTENFERQ